MNTDQQKLLFEHYKLYVEMTDRLAARRQLANNFFLAMNGALFSMAGVLQKIQSDSSEGLSLSVLILAVIGFIVCLLWSTWIGDYRQLADARYQVIHSMEQQLSYQCYQDEWKLLENTYRPLSKTEEAVARVLLFIYAALILYFLSTLFSFWCTNAS